MPTTSLKEFRKDVAGSTATTVLGILAIVVIPIGLFVLLFYYLRRATPEGALLASGGGSAPSAPIADDPLAPIAGARKCRRCGNMVKPYKTSHGPECPNCGSGMGG